jgi:putative YphP/YqiW family bacilliredoxin
MYPEQLVAPMRTDLTSAGFKELKTPDEVESELKDQKGTTLL